MKPGRWAKRTLLMAVAVGVLSTGSALAQKGGKGGGRGGGKEESTPFSVIELPGFSRAFAASNPDAYGTVTVAGEGPEGGYISAAYALVDVASGDVVSGLLPEPTDNAPVDSGSNARDVNGAGVIVGGADVYDETAPGNRRYVPVRWVPQGAGYTCELLPLLEEGDSYGSVHAVNEAGTMVGTSQTFDTYRPALWSGDGTVVVDPNILLPEGSDWILLVVSDINTTGQIVGTGLLDGIERGFVFDPVSGTIDAVPLVAGAVFNQAWQINDAGHVIGKANDDIIGGGPFPQGGWGFFWAGPGSQPQLLPSTTELQAIARGINNLDEIAGDSNIDGSSDIQMNLWQPNTAETFDVTALETQIPSKPNWTLQFGFGINDDLWICGTGRKFVKGKYSWHGVLVVPNF